MKSQPRKIFWFHTILSISLLSLFLSGCARKSRLRLEDGGESVTVIPTTLPPAPTVSTVNGQLVLTASSSTVDANQPILVTAAALASTPTNLTNIVTEFVGLNSSIQTSGSLENSGQLRVTSTQAGNTVLKVRAFIGSTPVESSMSLTFTQPLNCMIYSEYGANGNSFYQVGRQASFASWETTMGYPLRVTNVWTLDPSEQAFFPMGYNYQPSAVNQFSMIFRSTGPKTLFVRAFSQAASPQGKYCDARLDIYVGPAQASQDLCAFFPQLCQANQPRRCTFAAQWVGVRNADCGSNKCNKRVEATLNDGIRLPSDARDVQMQIKSLYLDNDDKKAKISINGSEVIRETDNFYNSIPNVSIGYLLRGGSNSVKVSVKSVKRFWSAVFTVSGEYFTPSGRCDHSFGYR